MFVYATFDCFPPAVVHFSVGGLTMKRVLPAVITIVFFSATLFAQALTVAQLNGTVRDASGGVIANAMIALRNLDTNRTYTSTSDASGYYIVPNLPPGSYELKVTYSGFEPYVLSSVQVTVGQAATRDVAMAVQG